ncbi:uncharacterized protein J4E79_005925 [Alternaria viburni]|uniref:uncharacterized protein n=1 Tax=Alternaria viburni TaxID=566460 RepID=UPI0020C34464|nr:uncharacterized protein J4E79_005925 [Alternaria viburni]KAI4660121.1 hypothetical protein J4E79_005925 [Alternaria viburni]
MPVSSSELAEGIHLARRELRFAHAARRRHVQCGTWSVDEDLALRRTIRLCRRALAAFLPAYWVALELEANFQQPPGPPPRALAAMAALRGQDDLGRKLWALGQTI